MEKGKNAYILERLALKNAEKYRRHDHGQALPWIPLYPGSWDPEASGFPSVGRGGWDRPPLGSSLFQHSPLTYRPQLSRKSVYEDPYLFQRHQIKENLAQFNTTYNTFLNRNLIMGFFPRQPQLIDDNIFFSSSFIAEFQHSVDSAALQPSQPERVTLARAPTPCFSSLCNYVTLKCSKSFPFINLRS